MPSSCASLNGLLGYLSSYHNLGAMMDNLPVVKNLFLKVASCCLEYAPTDEPIDERPWIAGVDILNSRYSCSSFLVMEE